MSDPRATLTALEVQAAGLDDWGLILGRLEGRFRTGDFATGIRLVTAIGDAAERANHHPDITITYSSVMVALSSHDVGGITSRDVELARQISAAAARLGVGADIAGLR